MGIYQNSSRCKLSQAPEDIHHQYDSGPRRWCGCCEGREEADPRSRPMPTHFFIGNASADNVSRVSTGRWKPGSRSSEARRGMCVRLRGTLKMLAAPTNPPGFLIYPNNYTLLYFHRRRLRSFECRGDFFQLLLFGTYPGRFDGTFPRNQSVWEKYF